MKPRVLFIVTSDPRNSPRPAEAVRIAAGVGAWPRVETTLYLRGAAALAVGEFSDDLVDGENFARYVPLVLESGRPIYVQRDASPTAELIEAGLNIEAIDDTQLAELAAASHSVVRF